MIDMEIAVFIIDLVEAVKWPLTILTCTLIFRSAARNP